MDWPGRSIWTRIAWTWWRLAKRRAPRIRSAGPQGDESGRIERLHSLGRQKGRSPLYVISVMDRDGHVLEAVACDPEEYAEFP